MELKSHFMIGHSDGALYDTRAPGWSTAPLRPDYAKHFATIENAAQFKATIRAGAYAWPGGYPIALYCADGGALCFDCGRKEARAILDSIMTDCRDGWRVVGCGIEHDGEESGVNCDHCGAAISTPTEAEEESEEPRRDRDGYTAAETWEIQGQEYRAEMLRRAGMAPELATRETIPPDATGRLESLLCGH